MSLRRFMVLVRGLGPHAATTLAMLSGRTFERPVVIVETEKGAERALRWMFGKPTERVN